MMRRILVLISALAIALLFFPTSVFAEDLTTVSVQGVVSRITSSPAGIDCPGTCHAQFQPNSTVTFSIELLPGTVFRGIGYTGSWPPIVTPQLCVEQDGSQQSPIQCSFKISEPQFSHQYVALISYKNIQYDVKLQGNGSGRVVSSLPGIDCGSKCSATFQYGQKFTLTAIPDAGSEFAGWNTDGLYICNGYRYSTSTFISGNVCEVKVFSWAQSLTAAVIFNKKPATTPKSKAPTAQSSTPIAPTLESVYVNDRSAGENIEIGTQDTLKLGGHAIPGGSVRLSIHSELKEILIPADKDGRWEYVISGLGIGGHYVEAQSISADGQKTSDKVKLLSFKVREEAAKSVDDASGSLAKEGTTWLYLLLTGMLVAASTLLFITKKRPTALNPIRRFWAQSKQLIRKLLRK